MDNTDNSVSPVTEHLLPKTVRFSDCDLAQFMRIAANFGTDSYAYAVTPNVDHLIRFSDDASFRDLYRTAQFVLLDSRFLAYVLRVSAGLRLPTSPGSDVTQQLFEKVVKPDDKLVVVGGSEEQARILAKKYGLRGLRHYNPPMGFIHDPSEVRGVSAIHRGGKPVPFLPAGRRLPAAGVSGQGAAEPRPRARPDTVRRCLDQLPDRRRAPCAVVDAADRLRMAVPADERSRTAGEPLSDPRTAYFSAAAPSEI